jgi:hypothetical protein
VCAAADPCASCNDGCASRRNSCCLRGDRCGFVRGCCASQVSAHASARDAQGLSCDRCASPRDVVRSLVSMSRNLLTLVRRLATVVRFLATGSHRARPQTGHAAAQVCPSRHPDGLTSFAVEHLEALFQRKSSQQRHRLARCRHRSSKVGSRPSPRTRPSLRIRRPAPRLMLTGGRRSRPRVMSEGHRSDRIRAIP